VRRIDHSFAHTASDRDWVAPGSWPISFNRSGAKFAAVWSYVANAPGAFPMQKLLARFAEDESGATAIEYALIVAALSVMIGAVLQRIGVTLDSVFRTLQQDTIIMIDGA
jgi:pilus assembly protein Flp/PilA